MECSQKSNATTPIYADVRRTIQNMLMGAAEFTDNDNLIGLGLDSMKIMRLVNNWRKAGSSVTFAELMASPCLKDWMPLLEKKSSGRSNQRISAAAQEQALSAEPFPLTDVQYAYWVGRRDNQMLGGVGCHAYLELDGSNIEPRRLEQAWHSVIDRHPMLRAHFLEDGTQKIPSAYTPPKLEVLDIRHLSSQEADDQMLAIRSVLSHRRLRVEAGEVMGIALSLLPQNATRIHLDVDLLVADLQSLYNILRDLSLAYSGKPLPAAQNWSFAAYLEREKTHRASERTLAEKYWKQRLDSLPHAPQLPMKKNPRDIERPLFVRRSHRLDRKHWQRVEQNALCRGITPAMALLTIYADTLERWSSESRFFVNIPLFNRQPYGANIDAMVADFTNILLLAVEYTDLPFWERAKAIQTRFHEDAAHAAYSGVRVLRDLARNGAAESDTPQVVFACTLGMRLVDKQCSEALGKLGYMISQTPQVSLDFQVHDIENEILFAMDAIEELFPEGMLDALFSAYMQRLMAVLEDDEDSLNKNISISLHAPHAPAEAQPVENISSHLHASFFAQAKRHGERTALLDGASGATVSYGALAQQALHIAALLQKKGVRPGDSVAVTLPRGVDQVAAVLGVLASGACYVPISPRQPVSRMEYMHRKADVRLVLTTAGLKAGQKWPGTATLLDVAESATVEPLPHPEYAGSGALAYIIFTSGSTGMPKGVAIEHAAAWNTVHAVNSQADVTEHDRVLAVSALEFDLSVYDIFGVLGAGGQVVLVPDEAWRDAAVWHAIILRHRVTIWNSVPILLDMLMTSAEDAPQSGQFPLRVAMLSGDRIPRDLPEKLWKRAPQCRFVAMGGATEAAIWSNIFHVTSVPPAHWTSIPYGNPLPNQRYRVVDQRGRDCPPWRPGELWIGGAGVARGYVGDADLTAQRFINLDGQRWYRTGDLGRYWPDGTIEFLGRMDFQLKIRGHRIEPGEIEAALLRHPNILQAAVTAVNNEHGTRRLVAYVAQSENTASGDLAEFLLQNLPEYMVPEIYVALDKLPLNANGKVDRKALPAVDPSAQADRASGDEPQSLLQQKLAAIWQQELWQSRVGIHDNFFQSGGDSLLATRLVSRIHRDLGLTLPLDKLFLAPTIAQIATHLEHAAQAQKEEQNNTALPAIVPDPASRHEAFPLTDIQHAYWIGRMGTYELGHVSSHIFFEFDSTELDIPRLETAWQKVVARHDMLRAVFLSESGQRVLETVPGYRINVRDMRSAPNDAAEAELKRTRTVMSCQMLSVDTWPLFDIRAIIYQGSDGPHTRLFLDFDALIADAWSFFLLVEEWMTFYDNPGLKLPGLELTFRDYVLAESAIAQTEQYHRDREYWLAKVDSLPPAPALPLACQPSKLDNPGFVRKSRVLESRQWSRIKENAAQAGVTPSGLLISAYTEILGMWSQNSRFTLNLTQFNRLPMHQQVDAIVGDFTSLVLLAVDSNSAPTFAGRARELQRQLWEDMDHKLFNGVQVLREKTRRAGGRMEGMPVVFTGAVKTGSSEKGAAALKRLGDLVSGCAQTPQVWLDHQTYEQDGALVLNWDAVKGLFPEGMIDHMFQVYINLLHALADEKTWELAAPAVLPESQQHIRKAFNHTTTEVQQEVTLLELFKQQLALHQQDVALVSGTRTLSYSDLNQLARAAACEGMQKGLRPHTLAAVVMEKGWEQVVACLAIFMSGAAYLPLSPDTPEERLHWILRDSEVGVVFAQSSVAERIHWPDNIQTIFVDALDISDKHAGMEELPPQPGDLAYVIYTSGSTGRPKGVMIDHRGAANTILDINNRFNVGAADRILALSALQFDLSVYDIFGMLACGGALVMPDPQSLKEPGHWLRLLHEHHVTLWNSVPALMHMLATHMTDTSETLPAALRLALLSGDWIPTDLPESLKKLTPSLHLVSLGGATEASIWSVAHYPVEAPGKDWTSIPYGRPLKNQRLYVLDAQMRQRPDWVSGHLYIGGIGLALGYWHDEAKTANAFITHPHTGERLYRTGDMARHRPEGVLEFLGRDDFQVKIQGHRIELGEIEACLLRHPAVREAVTVVAGEGEVRRLVCFVVPHAAGVSDEPELLAFLQRSVPAYMLPSAIIPVDSLPLTNNGKVDRTALTAKAGAHKPAKDPHTIALPRNDLELQIAAMWAETLAREHVGRNENFFETGGNSLLAVRLTNRLREHFSKDLPVITVFEFPTVAAQATLLAAGRQEYTPTADTRGDKRRNTVQMLRDRRQTR